LEDIQRLSEMLEEIDRRDAKFVLSYALCKESLKHFSKWINRRVQCQRNVSGFAKNRRKAVELTLDLINKDRVGVAHKINKAQTEVSLRKNVGRHMHAIVRTLDRLARP
jgi:hypothetical protein